MSLAEGWKPAKDSVLLDYLSPINVFVLLPAVRRRQFAVVLAIVGTLLISVLINFSTGLFITENYSYPTTRKSSTKNFDGTRFDTSVIDTRPWLATANLNNSLPLPVGTTLKSAFQPFDTGNTRLGEWFGFDKLFFPRCKVVAVSGIAWL